MYVTSSWQPQGTPDEVAAPGCRRRSAARDYRMVSRGLLQRRTATRSLPCYCAARTGRLPPECRGADAGRRNTFAAVVDDGPINLLHKAIDSGAATTRGGLVAGRARAAVLPAAPRNPGRGTNGPRPRSRARTVRHPMSPRLLERAARRRRRGNPTGHSRVELGLATRALLAHGAARAAALCQISRQHRLDETGCARRC